MKDCVAQVATPRRVSRFPHRERKLKLWLSQNGSVGSRIARSRSQIGYCGTTGFLSACTSDAIIEWGKWAKQAGGKLQLCHSKGRTSPMGRLWDGSFLFFVRGFWMSQLLECPSLRWAIFFLNVGKEALLQCKGFAEVQKCDRSSQDVCVGFDSIYLWIGPEARVNRWQMVSPGPQWKGKSTLTIVLCSQVPSHLVLANGITRLRRKLLAESHALQDTQAGCAGGGRGWRRPDVIGFVPKLSL